MGLTFLRLALLVWVHPLKPSALQPLRTFVGGIASNLSDVRYLVFTHFPFKIFLVMAWTTSQHLSSRIIFCTMLSTVNVPAILRHSSRFLVHFLHQNTACSEVSSSSPQKVQNGVLVRSNRKRCHLKALCPDRNCVIKKSVFPCLLRTHLRLPGIRCFLRGH